MVNKNNVVMKTIRKGNGEVHTSEKIRSSGEEYVMLDLVKGNLGLLLIL